MGMGGKQRDQDSPGWFAHEWHVAGLTAGPIRAKLSGVRYMHLLFGYGDLTKEGGRGGLMLAAVERERKQHPKSKLPLLSGITAWIYGDMGVGARQQLLSVYGMVW